MLTSIQALAGSEFKVLHSFGAEGDGTLPSGTLVMDAWGDLYGLTSTGGAGVCGDYGCGTAYELIPGPTGWNEVILHNFDFNAEGSLPVGPPGLDAVHNLYGVAAAGGPGGVGSAFELSQAGNEWACTVIYDSGTKVGLISGMAASLYGFLGLGQYQAGAIGELWPSAGSWNYAPLYSFGGNEGKDGFEPEAPLSWDAKGNLYGTTYFGGGVGLPNCTQGLGCGVAFQLVYNPLAPSAQGLWSYHVIHRFASSATDGKNPNGSLVLDAQGNAYGTTPVGGAACPPVGCGTVYKLTPVGADGEPWAETILYDFPAVPACSQGCSPAYNMVFDKAGNLYGVAGGGNNYCAGTCGVVFKLAPQANGQWIYSVVHEFTGPSDGANPLGLAIDANGNLFGTTQTGGTYNLGVAFEISQ
ncbi:MAG TPA: choice-of-anchor tandem repeat GloVer-containing protein [Terriglobales bacterium]|nr:choice-of-anchor tandem repeat GloVer-containing protein [Terriglobales bacterium]